MSAPSARMRLFTLPQAAAVAGMEYRTLHQWVRRGLVRASVQSSRGTGVPNLLSPQDTVAARVIAGLRPMVSMDRLGLVGEALAATPEALDGDGAYVMVGKQVRVIPGVLSPVTLADQEAAFHAAALADGSPVVVIHTQAAIEAVRDFPEPGEGASGAD